MVAFCVSGSTRARRFLYSCRAAVQLERLPIFSAVSVYLLFAGDFFHFFSVLLLLVLCWTFFYEMCPVGRKRRVCRVPGHKSDRCPIEKESNIRCVCKKPTCPRRSAACVVCEAVWHTPDNVEEKMEARAAP